MTEPPARLIVASRKYKFGSKTITGVIYQPVRMTTPPRNWVAEFEIQGLTKRAQGRGIGIDTMQAMMLAAEGLRIRLEALGPSLRFLGRVGDSGIPRLITTSFGLGFSRRVEKIVDEVTALVDEEIMNERRRRRR